MLWQKKVRACVIFFGLLKYVLPKVWACDLKNFLRRLYNLANVNFNYFHFAEGNVSILLRVCDPVQLTISAKFNIYTPN